MATKKVAAKKTVVPAAKKSVKAAKSATVKKMTKLELTRLIAEGLELTAKQSGMLLDHLAEIALEETKTGGEFTLPGLGKLVKAETSVRTGRNPQTGEPIEIKAKRTVKFRIAKAAKDVIAPTK